MHPSRLSSGIAVLILLITATDPPAASASESATSLALARGTAISSGTVPQSDRTRIDRIVVKFREGSGVRLRDGGLVSLAGTADLDPLRLWLDQNSGVTVQRHFVRDEADLDRDRETGINQTGATLADLNLYFQFRLSAPSVAAARKALEELRSLPNIETAFAEPLATPPLSPDERRGPAGAASLLSPDFSAQQGYLYASPSGVNAQAVWGYPGGRGAGVKILDIEGAWLWGHEDLKSPFFEGGAQIDDPGWRNHGTAVMGEMVGGVNNSGVTGIAADLQVGGVSIGTMSTAAAIDLASAHLSVGDLFLIELHAPGPNANGSGQFGFVPMEYWQDNFDAIQQAVANGRICIEAGGNGEQDLDDPVYQGLFDRTLRYSGAILVGAGTPIGLDAEWFTNYGSRLDLNGWGSTVVTCGYGDLQGGPETQWYTGYFSGTSSASPIVAGSVASLQGMCKVIWGRDLNGPLARQILFQTGTPWVGPKAIGRRPNLIAARLRLLQGIGTISGTVRESETSAPIAGATVELPADAIALLSDSGGGYAATVSTGSHLLRVSDFFHETVEQSASVGAGQTVILDFDLPRKPAGTLAGTITAAGGGALAGGRIIFPGTPIPEASSDPGGIYVAPGIPAADHYLVLYGLVPGFGAAARSVTIAANETHISNAILAASQTFEGSNGGFVGDAPWEWGAPSGPGPGSAFSGSNLWATNLSGNYGDNQSAYLVVPPQSFAGASQLHLGFSHWYELEGGFDGGNLQVKIGTVWTTIPPAGGYPMTSLGGLGGEAGFSGSSGGWRPVVYDLTSYLPGPVQVRFHFGSDSGVTAPGWYIDDVAFDSGPAPAAVETQIAAATTPPSDLVIQPSRPNPFTGTVDLAVRLSHPAQVTARIVSPDGREVIRLRGLGLAGDFRLPWDGRDAAGRSVPSGTYFCFFEMNGRPAGSQRIMRLR